MLALKTALLVRKGRDRLAITISIRISSRLRDVREISSALWYPAPASTIKLTATRSVLVRLPSWESEDGKPSPASISRTQPRS